MLRLNKFLALSNVTWKIQHCFSKQLYIFMNDKMRYNGHIAENTLEKHNVHHGCDNDKICYEGWGEVY